MIARIFSLVFFTFLAFSVHAAAPQPPELAVKTYLLKDVSSDTVLAAKNSETRIEPASLTKLMTAYITFEALKNGDIQLTNKIKISEHAYEAEGSGMFIEPRTPVEVEALLYGLIVQSGNDAAIALAEHVASDEGVFAQRMNEKAAQLGMTGTHFVNATGLPDTEHYTTAEDLMRLSEALIRDFPDDFKKYYSTKSYTYNKIKQDNRNRLLWLDPHVDGLKTGHTKSAGYCLIATAQRNGIRHIAITLGAKSKADRTSETQKLLNFGFQNYETVRIYPKAELIKNKSQQPVSLTVWKGSSKTLSVTVAKDLIVTVPKVQVPTLSAVIKSIQPLVAPIKEGQTVGNVNVTLAGEVIQTAPLVAAESVSSAGFFGRLWDAIRLYFANWF